MTIFPLRLVLACLTGALPLHAASTTQGGLQDQGAPPAPIPGQIPPIGSGPLLASDGKPAEPGRIPEGTDPAAAALWQALLAAGRPAEQATAPPDIRSFDLLFQAKLRKELGGSSNSEDIRFQFLEGERPNLLARFEKSKRISLRGPRGDWTYDGKNWIELRGREDAEGRHELDRWIAIARNFIALTRPAGIRLVSLRPLKAPETATSRVLHLGEHADGVLPSDALIPAALKLRWLEVESPDFELFDSGEAPLGAPKPVYRALFGLDAAGRVEMAWFQRGAQRTPASLFVYLPKSAQAPDWVALGSGYRLPRQLLCYRSNGAGGFEELPGLDLWLVSKRAFLNPLNPPLTPESFTPRIVPEAGGDGQDAPR
ncbi:MAG: hypothetical protein R3F33_16540 [Planctomycetota bacterium]